MILANWSWCVRIKQKDIHLVVAGITVPAFFFSVKSNYPVSKRNRNRKCYTKGIIYLFVTVYVSNK